ncbi:hypothetical protein L596_012334 [Steinernema carpocapsae]|uniref:Uncharacterized protein n=1 Tax=Steinernema carpocapsae TaxID=34508 RepID=A0A4U5NXM1_STECR|nr:hypothetical protein L596_012334 [Steinernema carpocapsae]
MKLEQWIAKISLMDLTIAFFIVELVIAVLLFVGTLLFAGLFVSPFSTFVLSFGAVLLGVDFAVFFINIGLTAATVAFDLLRLPCFVHMMIAGLAGDALYTFRIAVAAFTGSTFYPSVEVESGNLWVWSLLMTAVGNCCLLVHVLFLLHLSHYKDELWDYRNWRTQLFKRKTF